MDRSSAPLIANWRERPEMYIGSLNPGDTIRIKKDFLDYDRNEWKANQTLTLRKIDFFPYEGGHTLTFDEGILRLGELNDDNMPIINNDDDAYWELVRKGEAS